MTRKITAVFICVIILPLALIGFDLKRQAGITRITEEPLKSYLDIPRFATSELCTVRHDYGPYWAIDHWVIGNELYKAYQDPEAVCSAPYPFTVEYIYFVIQVMTSCTLYVSIDVETVDRSNPLCPLPGDMLTLSDTYEVIFPGAGLYQLEAPLDTPVTVNEPYFIGFFIANYVDSTWGAAVVTDSVAAGCVNYNIWDTTIGYIDVTNNTYYNFPGRMVFYSAGIPGGGSGSEQPQPAITILTPEYNEKISGPATIWAAETSGSDIIDYVIFEYRSFGGWHEIGRDYDGSGVLRNGLDPSGSGNGWAIDWDYSLLPEDNYWLKATVYDTLGRSAVDSVSVGIDPTPPAPIITSPASLADVCHPFTIETATADEDVTLLRYEKKKAADSYTVPVIALNQSSFGTNYCGPVAGAVAIKYWFDKGYLYSMREGAQYLSVDTVVQRLAAVMQTNENNGTYDDYFYYGFQQYIITHGNELRITAYRQPDYMTFRTLFEEKEQLVIFGLSGNPGLYLVSASLSGLADAQGRYPVKASDPLTGTITDFYFRDNPGGEFYYDGVWHPVDLIFAVRGYSHTVSRDLVGIDDQGIDGWDYLWSTSDMLPDAYYYLTAEAEDTSGRSEQSTVLIRYDCGVDYIKGDYNNDGSVNIGDAIFLIDFIYRGGDAPLGGAGRADANCDGNIDITDVVYIIKFQFEGGPEPCY